MKIVIDSLRIMESKDKDIFRDTPGRYLGYANEVGEAFRPVVNVKLVWASYGIASLYVLADTADKAVKAYKKPHENKNREVFTQACDALLWQSFASVIVPGFTINRICWFTQFLLKKTLKMSKTKNRIITVGVGLVSIPFIIKPIDHGVDFVMDKTFRPFVSKSKNV